MAYQHLLYQFAGGVATITLNRPEVLNSFNEVMNLELRNAIEQAADPSVRAVLLTGSGRGFSAGQDLAEATAQPQNIAELVRRKWTPLALGIRNLEKPVVCAVNGVAAGAGANLALCCDIVLAAESASFIQSFAKIGLIPDTGGTFALPRLVGLARATALMMLAEKVSAAQAVAMGLIYKSYPDMELLKAAHELASYLATQPTRGLWLTKQALNRAMTNDLADQLEVEAMLQQEASASADFAEGVAAFLAKRKPTFTGN